jgi:hypothetical protein
MIRINPLHPQDGPVLFAFVCVVGTVLALGRSLSYRIGTDPWWASVLAVAIVVVGFVSIVGGWLWIQREVAFADGTIVVRRWIDALRGRPGQAIPVGDETRVAITLENVRSLRIERNGRPEAVLTLGYWEPGRIRELVDAMRAHRIPFAQYWDGEYPPGT